MILTAHQPAYLPWLGYFDKIAQADHFVLFDVCPQESSGFENRNKILGPNGEHWLTVPVHRSRTALLSELEIVQEQPWQRKHWKSIEQAYRKAPFWGEHDYSLAMFYGLPWMRLVDLTHVMLRWFMDRLGLKQPITRASSLQGLTGTKSELVLSMCQAMGATEYVFGSGGRGYADVAAFERAGIKVRFQDYKHPRYRQAGHAGFVSHLSIIDLLFNEGPRSLEILRNHKL